MEVSSSHHCGPSKMSSVFLRSITTVDHPSHLRWREQRSPKSVLAVDDDNEAKPRKKRLVMMKKETCCGLVHEEEEEEEPPSSSSVEGVLAELQLAAEADAYLNRHSKPAIKKLQNLSRLQQAVSNKNLQSDFLDGGLLTLLSNWLHPLPDGSLPNFTLRTSLLTMLSDIPIDLNRSDRRDQLKRSRLGSLLLFLSKSNEETTANRKLARQLVDQWSRSIFQSYTTPLPSYDDKKRKMATTRAAGHGDLHDLAPDFSLGRRHRSVCDYASTRRASRPEPCPLDFAVRPQSKIDADLVRARARQVVPDQRRLRIIRRLRQLKASNRNQVIAGNASRLD